MIMNDFNRRAAIRIMGASILLAGIAAPIAWFIATESAEDAVVSLAMEQSNQFLKHFGGTDLSGLQIKEQARQAATTIVGGIFDIAEIYDSAGNKLAEALTDKGEIIEAKLPHHSNPSYNKEYYESLWIDNLWVLRVFIPLRAVEKKDSVPITGYFEGVRVIPEWQRDQIHITAFHFAFMTGLAALLCGATIYPIVVRLSQDNNRKTQEVLNSHIAMMEALGRAIAKRDSDTGAHNYRVAWIAAQIGEELDFSAVNMQQLIAGSFLHDIGKIGIPDAILLKPGKLDAKEMEIMRTHVNLGEQIITGMGWLEGARDIVAFHHEKWDGTGYPYHLAENNIPLPARIFAIADVFDALFSKRPYKEPLPFNQVLTILRQNSGTHFDPKIFSLFEKISGKIQEHLYNATEDETRLLLMKAIYKHFGLVWRYMDKIGK